jgi:hypothetical protein
VPSIKEFLAQKSVTEMITQFIPLIWLQMTPGYFQPKISGYWRHLQIKGWQWKLFCNRSTKYVSNSGSIVGLSVQLLKGSILRVIPLHKL